MINMSINYEFSLFGFKMIIDEHETLEMENKHEINTKIKIISIMLQNA